MLPSLLPLSLLFLVSFIVRVPMFLGEDYDKYTNCSKTFECGRFKGVTYPFWGRNRPSYCGHPDFRLECMNDSSSHVQIYEIYDILDINQANHVARFLRKDIGGGGLCSMLYVNASFNLNVLRYVPHDVNLTLFYHCPPMKNIPEGLACPQDGVRRGFNSFRLAFSSELEQIQAYTVCRVRLEVTVLQEAIQRWDLNPLTIQNASTIEEILKEGFDVEYDGNITYCSECQKSGGRCGYDWMLRQPECFCSYGPEKMHCSVKGRTKVKVLIGVGAGLGCILLTCIVFIVYKRLKRKRSSSSSALISRDLSRDSSLKPDPENGGLFFQTKLFTYKELDEATNHFDSSKELGDGGFGTVYHGKLRDGRVVAVKRLFEHNYKRVEQFMNEIEILSRLRHQNLVSLYGCTSRHSRELLLVYEFVPNGTVADHLHGERVEEGLLTWPIRMSIAIQSADALAYLHASEIIHRDVKSNNILLDNNFHVKVADFGLSRLFPTDVTHVSTAPQGTPGYVDPEYYQCYQLTNKSDVYSFGVVLIELISSKPAVDIGRHRHEINLANMAVNRIHNQALHELVDPSLGYDTDYSVRNMITLVAELAFRCLQQENEMRPCMTEVLEILRGIEKEEYKKRKTDDMDTSAGTRLLKTSEPLSPDTVTGKWPSKNTTPNTSG